MLFDQKNSSIFNIALVLFRHSRLSGVFMQEDSRLGESPEVTGQAGMTK
jgi:hypothetical protein